MLKLVFFVTAYAQLLLPTELPPKGRIPIESYERLSPSVSISGINFALFNRYQISVH